MKKWWLAATTWGICLALVGCTSEDAGGEFAPDPVDGSTDGFTDGDPPADDTARLEVGLSGLEPLGGGFVYEGWIIVDGAPVSTGRFSVDADGNPDTDHFTIGRADADAAAAFVLTIEPGEGDDPAPSHVHVLGGDIANGEATLSVGHGAALATDFADAAGSYVLNTPSSAAMEDYNQGIWWLTPGEPLTAGLNLPELPEGWQYEGWVVDPQGDGPISTGKFRSVEGDDSDLGGPAAGPDHVPPFPGQDFVDPARVLTAGHLAVISVEPMPDDSPAPFAIKPLVDMEIEDLAPPMVQAMDNHADGLPAGMVTLR